MLSVSADIKENSLLIAIFEVRIGSIIDEQFHDLERLFLIDEYGRKVECGLPGLRLKSIDKYAVILLKKPSDFLVGTAYRDRYQHLIATAN